MSAPSLQLTVFTKTKGPLTKRIALAKDGSIVSDGSACNMAHGRAYRKRIAGVEQLAELIEGLKSNQAIALGALRGDLPDDVEVTTKYKLNGDERDVIARTANDISYEKARPALVLFDLDTKGMPAEVAARLAGGYWEALTTVAPALGAAARVIRRSTSAGLVHSATGKEFPGSGGWHGYVIVNDGADAERFLAALHDRAWLAGMGWMVVGKAGQLLERSIVDRMVGGPERLVFEGPPIVEPPLAQDATKRRPMVYSGETLDTFTTAPPLSVVEQRTLQKLKAEAAQRLLPERNKARDAFLTEFAERKGISPSAAARVIDQQCRGVLLPDVPLEFDDAELNGANVANILDDPARFEGCTLADPLEGIDYGRGKAKVLRRGDGTPWIHSFAHGRTTYELRYDAESVRTRLASHDPVQLILAAELDEIQTKQIINEVADQLGVKAADVKATIKSARKQRMHELAKERDARRLAARSDPRPQLTAPYENAPWIPQMGIIEEALGGVTRPPTRDADGSVMQTRQRRVRGLHAFNSTTANEESDND